MVATKGYKEQNAGNLKWKWKTGDRQEGSTNKEWEAETGEINK